MTCAVLCLVTQSCPTLCDPIDCSLPDSSVHGDSPGRNTGVGRHALLQRIFPTHGSNPGLPHCRQILLSSEPSGKPKNIGVGGYPFSRESSQPKNWTRVSCITGRFFTSWTIRDLDSILKSRDITLLTKLCLVKATVFPVVMCGCESWTIKKAECWSIDAFELWCWRRLLRVLGQQGELSHPS